MEDPGKDQKLETSDTDSPRPTLAGPDVPGRIRWNSESSRPCLAPGARSAAPAALAAPARASPPCEPARREDPSEVPRHPALTRGFRVLLVDDNPQHRIPLLRALRDKGHSVLHAADGPSGERLCRASQFEIDALVARADMKRMCGFELARRVRRKHPAVRVLLMWRRLEGPEEARRAYEHGYAVIEEPFTSEELCRRLTGLLGSSHSDTFTHTRPDNDDRLMSREAFSNDLKKEN